MRTAAAAAVITALMIGALMIGALGCGDDGSNGARPDTGISEADTAVVADIGTNVRTWNRVAGEWVQAYGGDSAERFLRVHRDTVRPLHRTAARIEIAARQIEDARLRRHLVPISDAYRDQANLIVDIGDHVTAGEFAVARRKTRRLRDIGREKGQLANQLVSDFPELGREF
jgi:uncharacterized protein YjiS (DUF1127 family)